MTITAIVLAAGSSKRMKTFNKLLLKFNDKSILQNVIEQISQSRVDEIIVITGYEHETITAELKQYKLKTVFNPKHLDGMGSSIATGMKMVESSHVMICLGDIPLLKSDDYNKLIDAHLANPQKSITTPVVNNKQKNPVLFSHKYFEALSALKMDVGGKFIILNNEEDVNRVEFEQAEKFKDIDTLSDYDNLMC